MTGYFFDSSALVKFYQPESGSARVESMALSASSKLSISRLTLAEIRSAFAVKVRSGSVSPRDGRFLVRRFQEDVIANRFEVSAVLDSDFSVAGSLLEQYAFDFGLRTLDALQLAVALKLKQFGKLDYFVSADKVLCDVAVLEGMAVINPDVV